MKETRKTNKTKTKKTSSYVKKEVITQLSDEELLEQILKKNKEKKAKKKTYAKKSGVVKSTKVKKKVTTSTIDDSLLLDEILKKNKEKKARARKRKLSKGRLLVDSNTVENKIVKQILEQEEKEKDLIITKEINLKEYLEEQKKLEQREDLEKLDEELTPEPKEKKQRVYFNINKVLVSVVIFLLIFTVGIVVITLNKSEVSNALREEKQQVPEVDNYKAIYADCMNQPFNDIDNSEQIASYTQDLNNFLANYKASVYYYDLEKGYSYSYQADKKYYAASVVKTIPAMYIYEKAINGEINLDDTLVYSSKYNYTDSAYFDNVRYGTQVSIRDIIKYAIFYSDNTAYMMLLDYVGVNNLTSYAQALGLSSYMDTDRFGHINAYDGYLMFNKLNDIINNGSELGQELKYFFVNSDHNDLMLGEYSILAATKYGETYPNFHNVGIVYDTHPYVVSILTEEIAGDHDQKIRDIAKKVYELHLEYYKNRKEQCEELANKKSTE